MGITMLFKVLFILELSRAQFTSSEENEDIDLSAHLSSEQSYMGRRNVLRRSIRSTFSGMAKGYIPELENFIVNNCKVNGKIQAAEKLQPAFNDLKACIHKKKIFVTPREEYLAFIEDCFEDSVKKVKNCLSEAQSYFPDLIMALVQSITSFLYNDFDIIRVDMVGCVPKLNNDKVIKGYKECLEEVALRTQNSSHLLIPSSKAEYCQRFVPTAYCFTNMVKEHCDWSPGLAKYREDYVRSHKEPCEEKKRF